MTRQYTLTPEQNELCKAIWRKGQSDPNGIKVYKPEENDCIALRLALYRARKSWENTDPLLYNQLQDITIKNLKSSQGKLIGLHIVTKNNLFEGLEDLISDIDTLPDRKPKPGLIAEKVNQDLISFEQNLLSAIGEGEQTPLERAEAMLKESKGLFSAYTHTNKGD